MDETTRRLSKKNSVKVRVNEGGRGGGGLKERDEGPGEEERKREVEEDGGCDLMSLCHVPYR